MTSLYRLINTLVRRDFEYDPLSEFVPSRVFAVLGFLPYAISGLYLYHYAGRQGLAAWFVTGFLYGASEILLRRGLAGVGLYHIGVRWDGLNPRWCTTSDLFSVAALVLLVTRQFSSAGAAVLAMVVTDLAAANRARHVRAI